MGDSEQKVILFRTRDFQWKAGVRELATCGKSQPREQLHAVERAVQRCDRSRVREACVAGSVVEADVDDALCIQVVSAADGGVLHRAEAVLELGIILDEDGNS
jgi:hypothetical protein